MSKKLNIADELMKQEAPAKKKKNEHRVITVYMNDEAYCQLRNIGTKERKTLKKLIAESVNELFRVHGLSQIADQE